MSCSSGGSKRGKLCKRARLLWFTTRGQGEMDGSILLWLSVKHGMAYVVNNPNAQDM